MSTTINPAASPRRRPRKRLTGSRRTTAQIAQANRVMRTGRTDFTTAKARVAPATQASPSAAPGWNPFEGVGDALGGAIRRRQAATTSARTREGGRDQNLPGERYARQYGRKPRAIHAPAATKSREGGGGTKLTGRARASVSGKGLKIGLKRVMKRPATPAAPKRKTTKTSAPSRGRAV